MKKFILISMVFICLFSIYIVSCDSISREIIKIRSNINISNIHFLVFYFLELLLLCTINIFKKIDFKYYIISLLFCLLYACSDEIHQLFVSVRTAKVMDVCVDFCGSVLGSVIFMCLNYIYNEGFINN